ncbi:MAG: capsid assembly protein, partial [Alphaproteobacteria bacterium]
MMELTQPEEEVLIQEQEDTETETQRPENVPKKFWNSESSEIRVDSLLHSYQALEKKLSERSVAPEKIDDAPGLVESSEPEETGENNQSQEAMIDYAITLDHDLFDVDPKLNERLRAAGFTGEQAQMVYDLATEELMPVAEEIAGALQSEVDDRRLEAHFGGAGKWRETQRQLKSWGGANLPTEAFESLASSYEGVKTLHRLMQGSEPQIVQSGGVGRST